MRIIRGHDYYDGAGLGVDPGITFVREEVEYAPGHHPFGLSAPIEHSRFGSRGDRLSFFLVLIGGEVHPGIVELNRDFHRTGRFMTEDRRVFHYDAEAAEAAYLGLRDEGALPGKSMWDDPVVRIREHFALRTTPAMTDWMITSRVVTGRVFTEYRNKDEKGTFVAANIATLKDLEFFKCVDPATAHMRIQGFIGGVLPHGVDTVQLGDRDKIRKAGFDPVISFRTPKGAKKPRRRA